MSLDIITQDIGWIKKNLVIYKKSKDEKQKQELKGYMLKLAHNLKSLIHQEADSVKNV